MSSDNSSINVMYVINTQETQFRMKYRNVGQTKVCFCIPESVAGDR